MWKILAKSSPQYYPQRSSIQYQDNNNGNYTSAYSYFLSHPNNVVAAADSQQTTNINSNYEENEEQIRKDIKRILPDHPLLKFKHVQRSISNILRAFSRYASDYVGYCQGMGQVAALLYLNLEDEEESFWAMTRLLDSPYRLTELWARDLPGLPRAFFVLDKLIEKELPRLHQHLVC